MDTILVITHSKELNVDKVVDFLDNDSYFRFNVDNFFQDYDICFNLDNNDYSWVLKDKKGNVVESDNIKSVWHRRPSLPTPSHLSENFHDFAKNEVSKTLLSMWSVLGDVLWVNNPHNANLIELNKMYQLKLASECDLIIPRTCITTLPEKATQFSNSLDSSEMAIKTIGHGQVQDEDGNKFRDLTRLVSFDQLSNKSESIRYLPTMIQDYIEKYVELRITVVGSQLFACAIHSQDSPKTRVDWRDYDFENVLHEEYDLPSYTKEKLLRFMERAGLQFGAIDMIVTPGGDYVFLEVNPSGQWGWIESLTDMPIDRSLNKLLSNPGLAL